MKLVHVLILTVAVAGSVFAGDVPVPEMGLDTPAIVSTLGLISGVALIMRARRKK